MNSEGTLFSVSMGIRNWSEFTDQKCNMSTVVKHYRSAFSHIKVMMCRKKVICRVRVEIDLLPSATKLRRLGYVFTRVCHSVHRGGLPQCMLGYHPAWEEAGTAPPDQAPPEQVPSQEQTPLDKAPPRSRHPLHQAPPGSRHPPRRLLLRTVRILLECILVFEEFLQSTKTRNNPSIDYDW